MTPEQITKLRSILRLAAHLPEDERDEYLAAVTANDAQMREAVQLLMWDNVSIEQTMRERAARPTPPS